MSVLDLSVHEGRWLLFMARVDPDTTRLMRRWSSDTILRYIHTTAKIFTDGLAIRMFQYGNYTLIPPTHSYV